MGAIQQKELPRYRSHKEVWALKIKEVQWASDYSGADLVPEEEGYSPVHVDAVYLRKHLLDSDGKPLPAIVGGYFVVYDDLYRSFSPAKAFEAGYSLLYK